MKRQDILSLLITFAVGFFAGIYLYVSGFAGLMTQFSVPGRESVDEFVIVADSYGGCGTACPSFQVRADGNYRYLYVPEIGEESVLRQGTLPLDVRQQLTQSVTSRTLARQSAPTEPTDCASFVDGVDVVYEITIEGVEYTLDSCGTEVDGESDLWLALNAIWVYFGSL